MAAKRKRTAKNPAEAPADYGGFLPGPRGNPGGESGDWIPAFLAALRECGVVRYACESAGVSRRTVYDRKESDVGFAKAWAEAMDESLDQLEIKARQRAHNMSDVLMIFLLKSHRREIYGDRIDGSVDLNLKVVIEHRDRPPQIAAIPGVVIESQ